MHQPAIELGIASCSPQEYSPFTQGNATYFNILEPPQRRGFTGVWDRWHHRIDCPGAIGRCLEIVEAFKPNLIHVHGSEGFFGLMRESTSVPMVISLQGILNVYRRLFFAGIAWDDMARMSLTGESLKGRGILHDYLQLRKKAARERKILASCSHYIGRTEWDRAVLKSFNPHADYYHSEEVMLPDYLEARWIQENADADVVYCTLGGSAYKGAECLLEAISILKRSGRPSIKLRVAGDLMDGSIGPVIRDRLNRLDLGDAVEVLGVLAPWQIVSELLRSSVYVLPSHIENSPNSLCEAMLVGVPCVASHVGGVPTLVRDGVDGLLYHDRDPYVLAYQIDRILSDHDLAARIGARGQQAARQRHVPEAIAARTVEIYGDILRTETASSSRAPVSGRSG